jgi:hypothetical protein
LANSPEFSSIGFTVVTRADELEAGDRLAAVLYSNHEPQRKKRIFKTQWTILARIDTISIGGCFSPILTTIAVNAHMLTTAEVSMESDAPTQYFDLEIRILNPSSGEYPVEITLEDGAVARGTAPLASLTWESSGDVQKDGQRLFNTLLGAGRLREAWGATRSKQRRIRLRIDPPELHALPWEFLHDGQVMFAASASTPFSRFLPIDSPGAASCAAPIRVLALVSNPSDSNEIQLSRSKYGS